MTEIKLTKPEKKEVNKYFDAKLQVIKYRNKNTKIDELTERIGKMCEKRVEGLSGLLEDDERRLASYLANKERYYSMIDLYIGLKSVLQKGLVRQMIINARNRYNTRMNIARRKK